MYKFPLLFTLFIIIAGAVLYWAFVTMKPGQELVVKKEEVITIEPDEEDEVAPTRLDEAPAKRAKSVEKEEIILAEVPDELEQLKAVLQDLLDRKVYLKSGGGGSAVLTLQKFLNIYDEDLNLVLDQDFGPSTTRAVKKFQAATGLWQDGIVGPGTLKKMIDFLK